MHTQKVSDLPRKAKKLAKKADPAGSLSSTPRAIPKVKVERKPRPVPTPPAPAERVINERRLKSIAGRCEALHPELYKRLKDKRRTNLPRLAREVVDSPLISVLTKHTGSKTGQDPTKLTIAVIKYIRMDRPKVIAPKPKPTRKKPRYTAAQEAQQLRDQQMAGEFPPGKSTARTRPKGRPKAVHRRIDSVPPQVDHTATMAEEQLQAPHVPVVERTEIQKKIDAAAERLNKPSKLTA